MKKMHLSKIFFPIIGITVFAVAMVLTISVGFHNYSDFDVALANIEALADNESTIICTSGNCGGGLCHEFTGNLNCRCRANSEPNSTCGNGK